MPDIFISYKKEERAVASELATRLTEAGYEVWWDDDLLAGERYEDEIATVLDSSRAVVVLWSRQSVKSEWVKAEAEAARQQKKAFPIIIDDMPPTQMPLLYRGMHAARFEGWKGELDHEGYVELIGSIRDRIGTARGPELTEAQAEEKLAATATEAVRTIVANTADEARARPQADTSSPPRPLKGKSSPLRWAMVLAAVLLILGAGGTLLYFQMNAVSPDDAAKIERCQTWAGSGHLDWYTALPPLAATTADDCARASERFPDSGDYLAMLAMVRIAQSDDDAAQAVALANRAIDKGSAWGHYVIGLMYYQGINFAVDYARSATALKAAADMDLPRAQGRLCLMGIDGYMSLGIPSTPEQIGGYCTKGAEANDSFALLAIGYAYESGADGRIVNMSAAADYYRRAYELGNDDAAVRLGVLHHRGVGVPFDLDRAVALYQEAADHGNPAGMRSVAVSLELGEGMPQDVNGAAQMYEEAAFRRDIPALLLAGYGIAAPAVQTARQVYDANLLATPIDTITGQRMRGLMLAYNNLRTRDPVAAERELKPCADLGNAICEALLGAFYQSGQLTGARDGARALPLYESSAGKGNMYGQFWLGTLYEYGEGVTRDTNKAIEYFRLAATQGHYDARNRLTYYNQPLPN